ncbi:5'-Nucleotidase/apyrase like protein [Aduncisulcus paluster]|uniref:5'-Nucleotidase/apyrase like protein n=1 Tax=Aduncisulcus paluster TaxID=2918883 RepID=A0ABQ5K4A5_9EUKA|nr:5'-Nucleotidase/apyrase like protein [Aduncisulcus paluster]
MDGTSDYMYFDSGDLFMGSGYDVLAQYNGRKSGVFEVLTLLGKNTIPLTASIPGDNEFSLFSNNDNIDNLYSLNSYFTEMQDSSVLTNVQLDQNLVSIIPPSSKIHTTESGIKACIYGIIPESMSQISVFPQTISISDPMTSLQNAYDSLSDEQCDIHIVLSHCGLNYDLALAQELTWVGLIVSGHDGVLLTSDDVYDNIPGHYHIAGTYPMYINGTSIVSNYRNGVYFSHIVFDVREGGTKDISEITVVEELSSSDFIDINSPIDPDMDELIRVLRSISGNRINAFSSISKGCFGISQMLTNVYCHTQACSAGQLIVGMMNYYQKYVWTASGNKSSNEANHVVSLLPTSFSSLAMGIPNVVNALDLEMLAQLSPLVEEIYVIQILGRDFYTIMHRALRYSIPSEKDWREYYNEYFNSVIPGSFLQVFGLDTEYKHHSFNDTPSINTILKTYGSGTLSSDASLVSFSSYFMDAVTHKGTSFLNNEEIIEVVLPKSLLNGFHSHDEMIQTINIISVENTGVSILQMFEEQFLDKNNVINCDITNGDDEEGFANYYYETGKNDGKVLSSVLDDPVDKPRCTFDMNILSFHGLENNDVVGLVFISISIGIVIVLGLCVCICGKKTVLLGLSGEEKGLLEENAPLES